MYILPSKLADIIMTFVFHYSANEISIYFM